MKIVIASDPDFYLTFPGAIIPFLMELSQTHYDGVCNYLSVPGGFIYNWNSRLTNTEGSEFEAVLKKAGIDILCKVLEGSDDPELRNFKRNLIKALTISNDTSKWRHEINDNPG